MKKESYDMDSSFGFDDYCDDYRCILIPTSRQTVDSLSTESIHVSVRPISLLNGRMLNR